MMRIRRLDRYIAREFARLFTLFTLGAPVLFIIGDLTDRIETYLDRGLSMGQVALGYVYQLPLFVLWSFPVAGLIATVFTVNGMTRHVEVAAAKASGISFYRLVLPLPLLGILLTFAALGLTELVPITNRLRAEVLGERARQRSSRTDFVYRTGDGYVYAIDRLNVDAGRIDRLSVEREGDPPRVPGVSIAATQGIYEEDGGWTLRDGYLRLFYGDEDVRTVRFGRLRPRTLTETPVELLALPKDPDEMRYAELGRFIDILRRSGGRPLELMVDHAHKIAIPVATLVIILFAAPLATSSRRGGTAYGVGISLAITVVYLMLLKVAGAAGAAGAMPPLLAAWLPNGLFFVASVVLAARVRT